MNRRDFIKGVSVVSVALPALSVGAVLKGKVESMPYVKRGDSISSFPNVVNELIDRVNKLENM